MAAEHSNALPLGYELIKGCLPPAQCHAICEELSSHHVCAGTGGIRNAEKKFTGIHALAHSTHLLSLADRYLNGPVKLVRAIVFNKTVDNNWLVTWHQDKTVCVSAEFDAPDWGPWSEKDHTLHVQVPLGVLNNMVTLRIHLDPADSNSGCLKVIPSSHRAGLLSQKDIEQIVRQQPEVVCEAGVGDVLVMRPHLLHASSKAQNPSQRRVVHLEYSGYSLPDHVSWA